jgi:8-oxo-dGTP diphosphatase
MPKFKIKREFSAGGVVFRKEPEGILWLVIKPSNNPKWRLPKGNIGKNESSLQAAQREVREEAGIEVGVGEKVGSEKYFYYLNGQKFFKTVVFFLMEYLQEARESFSWETEAIDWLPYKEARERLAFENEKELLDKVVGMVK